FTPSPTLIYPLSLHDALPIFLTLAFTFLLPSLAPAQVTHGQKPMLPAPFATKSAGNAPEAAKPPAGFLPTVPKGFRVNVFATNLDRKSTRLNSSHRTISYAVF